jgi:transcriptional regulator with XRE-family HTH domain
MAMAEREGRPETVEVKKRRLRGALRQARLDSKMTQKAAADALVWSVSKIIRIEQGSVPVAPSDVRALLQIYGATDPSRIEELVDLAKEARDDGSWYGRGWSRYSDVLSAASIELLGNEPAAKAIYKYEPSFIPGMFQTGEYARGLLRALGFSEEDIERRLEGRAERQQLLDSPTRPELHFILGETALSRPVGDEDIMREQIAHVLELAKLDDISVFLLPFAAGAHRGMGSAFTVLQFDDSLLPDLLFLENAERESVSRDEEGEIRRYLELFMELQKTATKHGSLEAHLMRILRERFNQADAVA